MKVTTSFSPPSHTPAPTTPVVRSFFASPRLPRFLLLIGVILTLPALFHDFEVDDHLQRLAVAGRGKLGFAHSHHVFELYTFFDGVPEHTRKFMDAGTVPWWSDPAVRVAFFRPISSLLLWADHRFLNTPLLIHVHSIFWYLGTIFVAALLYRQWIREAGFAGLAGLMFALDHSHGLPAAWIAQRNTLITGFFGLLTLYFHDRGRGDHSRRDMGFEVQSAKGDPKPQLFNLVIASCTFGLALFSGEAAFGALAYLFAHAWVFERRSLHRALAPYIPALLIWFVVYELGNFGTRGSGAYVDPLHSPFQYLANVVQYAPLLAATELELIGIDFYSFVPRTAQMLIMILGVAVCFLFLSAIRPLFQRDPSTRFFVLGGLLSVLPSCATLPSARLTFLAGFGLIGALAKLIAGWRDSAPWFPAGGFSRARTMLVVLCSGVGHLCLSPLVFVLSMHQMTALDRIIAGFSLGLPNEPSLREQTVVVVNQGDPVFAMYVNVQRELQGQVNPAQMYSLSAGVRPLELLRTDEKTIVLSSPIALVQPGTDLLVRDTRPFVVGTRVELSAFSVEILQVNADGWPTEAKFTFSKPLEDPSLRFMQWKNPTIVPLDVPKIGERRSFVAQFPNLWP